MRARHGAYYRQMAEEAHDGLRGATGPMWRDRLTSEMGNLRAALDWFIATGDADAALSLASGMAWLWWINTDFAEGARWLGDALGVKGHRRGELAATAHGWHGYCVGMSSSPAAGVIECEEAVAQPEGQRRPGSPGGRAGAVRDGAGARARVRTITRDCCARLTICWNRLATAGSSPHTT